MAPPWAILGDSLGLRPITGIASPRCRRVDGVPPLGRALSTSLMPFGEVKLAGNKSPVRKDDQGKSSPGTTLNVTRRVD